VQNRQRGKRESLLQLTACAPRAVRHAIQQIPTSTTNREDEGGDTAAKPKTLARGPGAEPYRSSGQQKPNHNHHYHWQQHCGRQTSLASAQGPGCSRAHVLHTAYCRRGQVARAPMCCTPRTVYARLNADRVRHRNQSSLRPIAQITRHSALSR
jgi:hypothetical protein